MAVTQKEKERQNPERVRVQLDLNPQQMAFVTQLMASGGFDTRKDLFNNAVTLFGWAFREAQHGHVIGSLDRKTQAFTVVNMPVLAFAAQNTTQADQSESGNGLNDD
jgi:hypothetical protein